MNWLRFIAAFGLALTLACGGGGGGSSAAPQAPSNPAPTITQAPQPASVAYGGTATFNVVASDATSYQWRVNGVNSGTGSSISVVGDEKTANASVDVVVSNSVGSVTSTPVKLTVLDTAPVITNQSQSASIQELQTVTLSVTATGHGLQYEWKRDGVVVGSSTNTYSYVADKTATFSVRVFNYIGSVTSTPITMTVTAAPVPVTITNQPKSLSVVAGGSATFVVSASGTGPISYQWKKNGVNVGTDQVLTLSNVTVSDNNAQISVAASNSVNSVTSEIAILNVTQVSEPVVITTQPVGLTLKENASADFSVRATGSEPITYQWKKNGISVGSNSPNYNFTASMADNNANVQVVVSNSVNSVTSDTVSVVVNPIEVPVSITVQPQPVSVVSGGLAVFSVTATGTNLTYQWKKNGVDVGTNNPSYSIATTLADNGSTVQVTVSNSSSSVTSSVVSLTVTEAVTPVTITTQPQTVRVVEGATASFSVVAVGSAPITYQWKKNGINVGTNSSNYSFTTVLGDDNSNIQVVVSNPSSSVTSSMAGLSVTAAPSPVVITTQPQGVSVTENTLVSFSVAVTGTGPLSYQWKKNGVNVGPATPSYSFTAVLADDNSDIQVVVSNSVNSVTSSTVKLLVTPAVVPVAITTQPQGVTVTENNVANFSVAVTGTEPITYQWKKRGVSVGTNSPSYSFTPTLADNNAAIQVIVSNSANTVLSSIATLTVNPVATPVVITTQPQSQTVMVGSTATFNVAVTGSAPFTYQWKKNGINVGSNSSSYTTPQLTAADNGSSYQVIVSNTLGSWASSLAVLTVNSPVTQDLTIGKVRLNQAIQLDNDSVGMVAGRPIIFQVYPLAVTAVDSVTVRVQVYNDTTLVETATGTTSAPTVLDLSGSCANIKISGSSVVNGYTYKVTVDPDNSIQETNKSNNEYTGTLSATTINPIPITFVPLSIGGKVGRVTAANWDNNYGQALRLLWPIPDNGINLNISAAYVVTSVTNADPTDSQWGSILSELEAKRVAENTGKYYYGVMYNSGSGTGYNIAGLACLPGKSAIGRDDSGVVYPHELLHNFGKGHVACNLSSNAGGDNAYPYANGMIVGYGAETGFNPNINLFKTSGVRYDLMSYCSPQWISDYNYNYLMNKINATVPVAAMQVSNEELIHEKPTKSSSLVWGTYNTETNEWVLEPTFTLGSYYDPSEEVSGSTLVQGLDKKGRVVMQKTFKTQITSNNEVNKIQPFAVRINSDAEVAEIRIVENGKVVARQTSGIEIEEPNMVYLSSAQKVLVHNNKAVMVVNEAGEVVSIVRNGVQVLEESGKKYTLHVSNGVRSQKYVRSFE